MNLQPIFDLAHICYLKGIKQAIISPGSRNAALTIAFSRHPNIRCYSVSDERSAAFMALGMSLKTKVPTVLICTSGSAALNYFPAVAEAYFNQVPLLILTADRPPEWIGQRDGQTIYQEQVYGKHVKQSYVFPSLEDQDHSALQGHKMTSEAINLCMSPPQGPVHLNIPFREPFYPEADTQHHPDNDLPTSQLNPSPHADLYAEIQEIRKYKRILIVVGQQPRDQETSKLLSQLSAQMHIPVVADIISNAHDVSGVITKQDVFLKNYKKNTLQPELLITIGLSVISKSLKTYLRSHQPAAHWHVRVETEAPDTYLALTKHMAVKAKDFLQQLMSGLNENSIDKEYLKGWQSIDQSTQEKINNYTSDTYSEINAYKKVMVALPDKSDLHLANSMAVRYANVIGLTPEQFSINIYCNRGTSGIDGSNSTAVGSALMTQRPTFLLTGDVAFFYDNNAFWHNHLPDNICIVVFNNHGGGIFRMIDGPADQPELEEFFETRQRRDASAIAAEYQFDYHPCHKDQDLDDAINWIQTTKKRGIIEIFTNPEESKQAYKELFRKISN